MLIFRYLPVLLLCVLCSCSSFSNKQEAHRSQQQLDDAELLMEVRHFDRAEEKCRIALASIERLLLASPENIDYRLIRIRALMGIFMSQNTVTIQQAKPQPRSLIRIPAPHLYKDFQETAGLASDDLKELINTRKNLSLEQKSYIHGMLGAILRLRKETAREAEAQYEKALTAYQIWINELIETPPKVGSQEQTLTRLRNQVRGLRMAQVEINLLLEDWKSALSFAEEAMAGKDLEFFPTQFSILEKLIAEMEMKVAQEKLQKPTDLRVQRLTAALNKKREKKEKSALEELASTSPYKIAGIQARLELAVAQNNLMYRIICYRYLNDTKLLAESQNILRNRYPALDIELEKYLQVNK
jgi:antitoxin component HigA of HigAB toxin-antitoxin module